MFDNQRKRNAMTEEQIQPGSSVESACRKCKTVTDHHVVIMDGDAIGKVECKVCGGKHAYRPPKPAAKPKTAPAEKPARAPRAGAVKKSLLPKKPSPEVLAHWENAVHGVSPDAVLPYAMSGTFQAGDVINHPTFGLGYVQKFIKPNMIEVLFQDSIKNLRCCA
jgi:hypothetical protein